ncbi:hypothetical protein GCM10018966_039950 [Streptomyces yanii]
MSLEFRRALRIRFAGTRRVGGAVYDPGTLRPPRRPVVSGVGGGAGADGALLIEAVVHGHARSGPSGPSGPAGAAKMRLRISRWT